MSMKRTDLEKNLGLKINGRMRQTGTPDRFGKASGQGTKGDPRLNPLVKSLLKKGSAQEK